MSIYAVNGKEPVAAWIPSRDTAGNGTTTLTDLVGSNDGTLTNMDAGTDWVADTDAGGVRALDFDGANDYVATGYTLAGTAALSVSLWFKMTSTATSVGGNVLLIGGENVTARRLHICVENGLLWWRAVGQTANITTPSVNDGAWHNLVFVKPSGGNITDCSFWLDGVVRSPTLAGSTPLDFSSTNDLSIGGLGWYSFASFDGNIDDTRIWGQDLDADDVAWLYNSGDGRARVADNRTRLRQSSGLPT